MTIRFVTSPPPVALPFKGIIFGKPGIGKTRLIETLPEEKTLFINAEGGYPVPSWKGNRIKINSWKDAVEVACLISGGNPLAKESSNYSLSSYQSFISSNKQEYLNVIKECSNVFFDSLTSISRMCFSHCKEESFSQKTQQYDMKNAYQSFSSEIVAFVMHLKNFCPKNVFFTAILDERYDENYRSYYTPQIEGIKSALEIIGILDEVFTMRFEENSSGETRRVFITDASNTIGVPAKDRSGKLSFIENADLNMILDTIIGEIK